MRRKQAPKRDLLPDPKYSSELLAKFINHLMLSGKKSVAEKIVYDALVEVEKRMKDKPLDDEGSEGGEVRPLRILSKALSNIRPALEVRARRVGGATYQVPVEVRHERSMSLGMRWLINCAKVRHEKSMMLRLAAEMAEACEGRGAAVKKRDDTHRMAKANQAFAHYRW